MKQTSLLMTLKGLLDLRSDTEFTDTDASIRKNVDFKSANAWTLVFAIFIASVGLNTNSTAVIIGAMLVSPLMGPIVGAGYALGINDFELLNRSWRNLFVAVIISLATSMLYFFISPLSEAQSELLARTSPTFYDVLIAAFGGAAGIVAMSRKEKSNAIPGVAIATALMPPLCTAGFGLANLEFSYFFGALYLFVINSVFICLSTYIFVRFLNFSKVSYANAIEQKRIDRWIMVVASIVIVPSIVTAWLLLEESTFKSRANQFIEKEMRFAGTVLVEKKISYEWRKGQIDLTVMGDSLSKTQLDFLEEKKLRYGLEVAKLKIHQVSFEDRINQRIAESKKRPSQLTAYRQRVIELEAKIKAQTELSEQGMQISDEIKTFMPKISLIDQKPEGITIVWSGTPSKAEKNKVAEFLAKRIPGKEVKIWHVKVL